MVQLGETLPLHFVIGGSKPFDLLVKSPFIKINLSDNLGILKYFYYTIKYPLIMH